MGTMGPLEIMGILAIVILLFGAKKIPDLAKGLGLGIKEFKKATRDNDKDELEDKSEKEKNS